ncbi:hypothetical protein VTL71DRAFT_11886 [Oculimacula yallundae]|uniref:Meiotic nuclear division protein 1 n=1 Tax=Oculimacula yallundae TaxID=86028 RepID=A0ABR4CRA8_9HELO
MNVFTLKELEKTLASVASIHAMQVKEYLQAMQDENLIRVEKIGSGNWYWCFTSDAKKAKENILNKLKAEEGSLMMAIEQAEKAIEEETKMRDDEEEGLAGGNGMDRKTLLEAHGLLEKEKEMLDRELAAYSDNDPVEIQRKIEETKTLRDSAIRWTDNIESMESYIGTLTTDRAQMAEIMSQACGAEYVFGEGLKDLC